MRCVYRQIYDFKKLHASVLFLPSICRSKISTKINSKHTHKANKTACIYYLLPTTPYYST